MGQREFVHLHVHTEFSLLDGAGRVGDIIEAAARQGSPAIAITDHGVMYGVIEFYKAARARGIKPIIGCEFYVARGSRFDRKQGGKEESPYHLVLLAENMSGYKNLLQLVTKAYLEGFYYKPRIDLELLAQHADGLIGLSGCLAGEVPARILAGDYSGAREAALRYQEILGRNNFFLELQDHRMEEQQAANKGLVQLAGELGIPVVATNDVHYVRRDLASIHDILLCIQTGKTLTDTNRLKFPTEEFYLKTPDEMYGLFGELEEALRNSLEIADRCESEFFEFDRLHLPNFPVPQGLTDREYLRALCEEGLRERYGVVTPEVRDRAERELDIIAHMGFSSYFLIVWDLVRFAREKGIPVGPGRGSAAGSLVAYCLGITNLDPLRYGLLFERFLNPERVSMPDIDIDFCFERREEVLNYVAEKYGSDHVAQIITFGTMAARAAVRDVGRVLGVPLADVDRLAKLIPEEIGISIERALEESPELKKLCEEDVEAGELIKMAKFLEGTPRHASTHAAGVVISKEPLVNYVPLQMTPDGTVVTQFPMQTIEEIGLLKMDLLGLRTLTVIGDTVAAIKETRGETVDLDKIPLDDQKTYDLLSNGESTGVFQLESSGMRSLLKQLLPRKFEDLIALVALYRPGPLGSGMVDDFIRRKRGFTEVEYIHPDLKPILEETCGVIVYQEQVMRIASELAGFTLGQADLLRRAMGKKKPEILLAQRENFIKGAQRRNIPEKEAAQIFDLMEYFAGYGFNKSHSASYALLAFQTAYLKAHYPAEFMASLLTSVMDNPDKVPVYIDECRRLGIEVLPPDVNESKMNFAVHKGRIRFGLAAIKNVGRAAIESIIEARERGGPFKSLDDFLQRIDLHQVNRRMLECLAKCGALHSLNPNRRRILESLNQAVELATRVKQDRARGQVSLFELLPPESNACVVASCYDGGGPDYSLNEILKMEKELLGFYLSGHPLEGYRSRLEAACTVFLGDIGEVSAEKSVRVGGLITGVRKLVTRRGETMAYFKLEDITGSAEVCVFPRAFGKYGQIIRPDAVVLVEGKINIDQEGPKIIGEHIQELLPDEPSMVHITLVPDKATEESLLQLRETLVRHRGNAPVYLHFVPEGRCVAVGPSYWVRVGEALRREVEGLVGGNAVRIC